MSRPVPELLLANNLKTLRLPTLLLEQEKLARHTQHNAWIMPAILLGLSHWN